MDERHAKHNKKRDPFMSMRLTIAAASTLLLCAPVAYADLAEFGNGEREAWFDAADGESNVTSIGFDDLGLAIVTDQYEHLGVTFTDGNDSTQGEDFIVFPRDGWGLDGNEDIVMEFDSPVRAIAVDFPGAIQFDLYDGQTLIDSIEFIPLGFGNFAGIHSSEPFDRVVSTDPLDSVVAIDNLHFATVPAPAGLLILLPLTVLRSRIRRRGASI